MKHLISGIIATFVVAVFSPASAMATQSETQETVEEQVGPSLQTLAASGDAGAQHRLGLLYAHGKNVHQNNTKALEWIQKSVDQGYADAQFTFGLLYLGGLLGVKEDSVAANRWFRLAADQGHAAAQFNLGYSYFFGRGVPQDRTAAAFWYSKSADQGNVEAQVKMGLVYSSGDGVPQNYALAARYLRQAADRGNVDGMTGLAWHYQLGYGVPKDNVQSLMWFILAAAKGDQMAVQQRNRMSSLMLSKQVEDAQNLALQWHPN
jgi:uncharacterized protein